MNTRDSAKAFDALMQETPYSHFDSGCEALYRNAVLAAFIAPSGNISPACLQSVPTAAIPFQPSKSKWHI